MANDSIKPIIDAELENVLGHAKFLGFSAVEITAGSLQKRCRLENRTPAVCNAMRDRLRLELGDKESRRETVKPFGDSTTNTFRYSIDQ